MINDQLLRGYLLFATHSVQHIAARVRIVHYSQPMVNADSSHIDLIFHSLI